MAVIVQPAPAVPAERARVAPVEQPHVRILYADVLRDLAIVMVVILHAAGSLALKYTSLDHGAWWAANLLDSLTRSCVPLFFMVSGFFLLDSTKEEPLGIFFRKRVRKVVVPFLGWAAFYIVWNVTYHQQPITLPDAIKEILAGPVYFHLWFVYTLIGLYLAAPIMRLFVRHATRELALYFLGLWVISAGIVPVLNQYFGLHIGIEFFVVIGELGFFVAGGLLRDARLTRRQIGLAAALFVLAGAFTVAITGKLSTDAGKLGDFFYNYPTLNVMAMAFALFLIVKSIPFDRLLALHPRIQYAVVSLSRKSLGIYFVHVVILELLHYGDVLQHDAMSFMSAFSIIIGIAAAALVISYIVIAVMQCIPVVRALVP
jgi:surface polysaccharide O-acyltransferase-like enzyme